MELAPQPKQMSLLKLMYNIIVELDGATEQAISVHVNKDKRIATKKQIKKGLDNGTYRGYFILSGNMWRIAPASYYRARQEHIKKAVPSKKPARKSKPCKSSDVTKEVIGRIDTRIGELQDRIKDLNALKALIRETKL